MKIIHGPARIYCQYCDMSCSADNDAITFSGWHDHDSNKPFEFSLCGRCKTTYIVNKIDLDIDNGRV